MLQVVNAAVIVDPLSRETIASATDETCRCPSSESNGLLATSSPSLSNAIGLVPGNKDSAKKLSFNQSGQSYSEVCCLYPWGWIAQRHNENCTANCGRNNFCHPLRHAALVAVEKAAARDRHLFPGLGSLKDSSHLSDSSKDPSDSAPAKRQKTNNPEVSIQLLLASSRSSCFCPMKIINANEAHNAKHL